MIRLLHVSKVFREGPVRVPALSDVSFTVEKGEFVVLSGGSGAGKTTLLRLLYRDELPSEGAIEVADFEVTELRRSEVPHLRRSIGVVFQDPKLLDGRTVFDNVAFVLRVLGTPRREVRPRTLASLKAVGLSARAQAYPHQLSQGEAQRAALARALVKSPALLLADEPTGNLDAQNEEIVLHLLRQFHKQGRTIVMVTHDPAVARLADRKVELHHGHVAEQESFKFSDEEQFDEVLEEVWTLKENGVRPEVGRMHVSGPLPVAFAVQKMTEMGLLQVLAGAQSENGHKEVRNRCHEVIYPESVNVTGEQNLAIDFTPRGEQRAANIIRRHRLAERLFMETLHIENEAEVEQQACKFEHILSAQATERICTFLDHPRTCPHGSPIPEGECCVKAKRAGNGSH